MWEKLLRPVTQYRGLPRPVYVLFLSRVVTALGMFVGPMMTLILTLKYGLSAATAGAIITGASLGAGLCSILGGRIADRASRKWTMILFQSLSALIFIVCAFLSPLYGSASPDAPAWPMIGLLILAYLVGALGGPAGEALMMDLTEPKNRKVAYSLSYMGFNFGFAFGAALAGFLFKDHLFWVFAGDALTTLLSLALIALFIPDAHRKTAAELASDAAGERGLEKAVTGSLWSVLKARPILPLFALVFALYQFCYSNWAFLLPLQMGQLFGADGARYQGLLASLNGVVVISLTPLLVHWMRKMQPLSAMAIGGVLFTASYFTLGASRVFPLFLFAIFVFSAGEVTFTILQSVFIASQTPSSHRGRISATVSLIAGAGWSVGPVVSGLIAQTTSASFTWNAVGVVMVFAVVGLLLLKRLEKPVAPEAEGAEGDLAGVAGE